jgi:phage tail protein X
MKVRAQQNDTVDLLCWRYYGRTAGITESVYEANPTLCEKSPLLSAGQDVWLPEQPVRPQQEHVQLWD